jgi:AraC family cel operon transcriptional repressor
MPTTVIDWNQVRRNALGIYGSLVRSTAGSYRFPEHRHHGFSELVVLVQGHLVHSMNGEELPHPQDAVVLVRDGVLHALTGEQCVFVNLVLPDELERSIGAYLGREPLFDPDRLVYLVSPGVAQELARRLFHLGDRPEQSVRQLAYLSLLSWLLQDIELHRSRSGDRTPGRTATETGTSAPGWLMSALDWFLSNSETLPSVREFVRKTGYSAQHVHQQVKRHFGTTPSAWLADYRLARAEHLLATTNLRLLEIVRRCGLSSSSYFHRLFREAYGTTPAAYRRRYREGYPL